MSFGQGNVVGEAIVIIRSQDQGLAEDIKSKVARAADAAKAEAKITADTSAAEKSVADVGTKANAAKAEMHVTADTTQATKSLDTLKGTGLSIVTSLAAGLGSAGLGQVLQDLGAEARELALIGSKAAAVFGDETDSVREWAATVNRDLGLTRDRVVELAAGLADLLKPMGFTSSEAAGIAEELIGLSGALSAWSAGQRSASEVADIITAALLGEREGLKQLGISISEADVQARLAAKGQENLTGAALEQAQALATQQLIMEKSVDAQRAYADGSLDAAKKTNHFRAALAAIREDAAGFLGPHTEQVGGLIKVIGPGLAGLSALNQMMISSGRSLGGVAAAAAPAAAGLAGMAVAGYAGAKAGEAVRDSGIAKSIRDFGAEVDDQLTRIPVLGGWLDKMGLAHKKAADKADEHVGAEKRAADQFRLTGEQAAQLEMRMNDLARATEQALGAEMSVTDAHNRAWQNAVSLREAEQDLAEAYQEHGRGSAEAERAEIRLEQARISSQRGVIDLARALTDQEAAQAAAKNETLSAQQQQEIFRGHLRELAGTVKDPMRSEILLLTQNLKDLSSLKPKVEVNIDTARAQARIAELRAQIQSLGGGDGRVEELAGLQGAYNATAPAAPDLDFSGSEPGSRQHGGPMFPGRDYWVGEAGMEKVRMHPGGGATVVPAASDAPTRTQVINVDVYNAVPEPASASLPRALRRASAALNLR